MSALPTFPAVQEPQPEAAGPEPAAPSPQPSSGRKWLALLLLIPIAAAGMLLRSRREVQPASMLVRTAKAFRGVLVNTVRLNGSIEAVRYANLLAPRVQAPDSGRGMVRPA